LWRDRLEQRMWRIPLYFLGGMVNAAMGLLAVVALVRVRRRRKRRFAELEAQEAGAELGTASEGSGDVWHDR
jgi:MYXO-CTERM domain-containing protein